ncbi:hypothetical protein [Selenomonas sp. AB3002]|uniref:hypothetical protein n=1 Tax=Selenomonas sp. AB3002 TaxID=1392502 RepID=UPI00163AD929
MAYESLKLGRKKRALNMVWSAAGSYGFRPEFLAFQQSGEPDLYLNSIVGFVHRHYEVERLSGYFRELNHSLLGELFTELFWLGLEEAAFQREQPHRPVLKDLRRRHAETFLAEDTDLAMQQLMMRQELAHTLKCIRCREILGEKVRILNPWDKRLYEALRFTGEMDTGAVISAMEGIIERFFRFHWESPGRRVLHFGLNPRLRALLGKVLPHAHQWGQGNGSFMELAGAEAGPRKIPLPGLQGHRLGDEELTERFGAPLWGRERQRELEAFYCRGPHARVRLWLTAERGQLRQENLDFLAKQQARYRTELRDLAHRLKNSLLVHRQPMELPSRRGRLSPGRIWRGLYLRDERVFSAMEPAHYGEFSLLLLLDASASRESRQAVIASQACLIAEAMGQAGIPLGAASFFSEGGCTVLRQLKTFTETSAEGIFSYEARGWNRDGLALRAVPELFHGARGRKILLILTDANPSDEAGLPAHGLGPAHIYGGQEAMEDTANSVKELRKQGIKVLALVNSVFAEEIAEDFARKIYGENYIRLQDLSQLAQKVGDLLAAEIEEY